MNEFVWLIRLILSQEWDIADDKLKNVLNLEVNWIPRNLIVWGLFAIKHNLISHCIHCCTKGLLIFQEMNKTVFLCRYQTATDAVKARRLSDNTFNACPQASGFSIYNKLSSWCQQDIPDIFISWIRKSWRHVFCNITVWCNASFV